MEQYCIYLRKSRADAEAESRGEGETLARHKRALLELAKQRHLNITKIYPEIVSGDTIAARPIMQQLLSDVEQGIWSGVLVMEVERLARGDTMDQGLVSQTFKYSGTKIVTPMKTYDPLNEFDEEYFEFGLFMSRREYKTINRRLQRGHTASIKEGKFVGSRAPYGYNRKKIEHDKGFTLEANPEQAKIVRLIFSWYVIGTDTGNGSLRRLGSTLIAKKLNNIGVPSPKGVKWTANPVRQILHNPVYAGKIRWQWRPEQKIMSDGHVIKKRKCVAYTDAKICDGLHEPIIPFELFQTAQEALSAYAPSPIVNNKTMKNPLSGIIVCGKCGFHMIRHCDRKNNMLICPTPGCNNVSSILPHVESSLLDALRSWLTQYKIQISQESQNMPTGLQNNQTVIEKINSSLNTLKKQLNTTHDLLEQGIYSIDVFLERSKMLGQQIDNVKHQKEILEHEIELETKRLDCQKGIIPKAEHLLKVYQHLDSVEEKNRLLKEILEKVVYTKTHGGRWDSNPDDFELVLFPRLPNQ